MNDFAAMHIFKCQTDLNHPMENLLLRESLAFLLPPFYMVRQVTNLAILHDNRQRVRGEETFLILHDVWMHKIL